MFAPPAGKIYNQAKPSTKKPVFKAEFNNTRWRVDEDIAVIVLYKYGTDPKDIAVLFHRTLGAVLYRLAYLRDNPVTIVTADNDIITIRSTYPIRSKSE